MQKLQSARRFPPALPAAPTFNLPTHAAAQMAVAASRTDAVPSEWSSGRAKTAAPGLDRAASGPLRRLPITGAEERSTNRLTFTTHAKGIIIIARCTGEVVDGSIVVPQVPNDQVFRWNALRVG
jgi:hypothetical protein